MTTVAFVLVSWRPDIPAGMERAVAAHAAGLADAGHRAVIITADHTAPAIYRSATVAVLTTLKGTFPCDDATLRTAINVSADALRDELARAWGDEDTVRDVAWPLTVRIGRVG